MRSCHPAGAGHGEEKHEFIRADLAHSIGSTIYPVFRARISRRALGTAASRVRRAGVSDSSACGARYISHTLYIEGPIHAHKATASARLAWTTMAGRALGVLLAVAVAALLAAADDDDKAWKCFRSCAKNCHHHHDNGSATVAADFPSGSGDAKAKVVSAAVSADCKSGCQDDACFKDLPAISSTQCAIATCLSHPHRMCAQSN